MTKTPIAVALERQIPEHIREEYALFVDFIKAYYAFLEETQQRDLEDIRSIDRTLDQFIIRFKKELSALFPTTGLEDERFILQKLKEFYKSRGSKESYQFLFRAFFNRDTEVLYPSTQILRASDGKWQQEKSVFVEAYSGTELFELAGKVIRIKTNKKHIDVYCPRVKYYRAGIYEVYIDRAYSSDIGIGDVISHNEVDVGTISPCPSKYTIIRPGSGFEVGKLYNLPSESGDGSIIKITKINSDGGIKKIQIISFGLDYETSFFAKLSNTYYQPLEYFHPVSSATLGSWSYNGQTTRPSDFFPSSTFNNNVVDAQGNLLNPTKPKAYGDTSLGYTEFGYINRNDYFLYQTDYKGSNDILDITESNPDNIADPYYGDGTYVGEIIASFYTNASNSVVIDQTLAEIQIDLGAVAVYPGYYSASDGFISDEIYIQDGKYYQLFSYVLKVEEQLDTYSELVKSLLHPAGFELFAQYNIKNDYLVSAIPLEAFVRYQYFERVFARDASYWAMHKDIANSTLPTIDNRESYHLDRTGIIDNIESFDTYRNLAQPSIHLNKWDIAMGNETNPLEDSIYTAVGNFENRVLGGADTMQWERTLLGDFIESVIDTVTGRAIVKGVSTEAPIEAAFATAAHSPGFDWEFAGATWRDDTGLTIDVRSSAQNPSTWSLGVSTEAPLINSPADARDYFNRADAASSSITYDRSIIPLSQDSTSPTTEGITLRELDRTGIADSTNILTNSDNYSYTWAKFKQPVMGLYTATLVAGSTDVVLTGLNGVVFNTFTGLTVVKHSGVGSFRIGATVVAAFVTPNNKFTTSEAHTVSGEITFRVSSSDTAGSTDLNADLNGYATAIQSDGIEWELGSILSPNPPFIQTVSGVDNIPRDNIVIPYDRSTIPLEQTGVTVYSDGLGWDISGFSAFADRQTATVSQNIPLREITQSYSGVSGETVSTTHSGMNWSFTTDAFTGFASTAFSDRVGWQYNYSNPSQPYVTGNSGGVAAADITINFPATHTALSNAWLKVAVNSSPANFFEAFIMDLIRTPIGISTYGDLTNNGDITSVDALAIRQHIDGTNTDPVVTSNANRFLQLLRRASNANTIAGHDANVAAGYYIYTLNTNRDISLGLQNTNTVSYNDSAVSYTIGAPGNSYSVNLFSLTDVFNYSGCTVTQSGTQLTFTNSTSSSRAIVVAVFRTATQDYYVPVRYIYIGANSSTSITLSVSATVTRIGILKILTSTNSVTIDVIDPIDSGILYYNPYNMNELDVTTISSYNGGGTYFSLDSRAIT
jgi:hypothetical protein